jgi:lysyl endopeptidase
MFLPRARRVVVAVLLASLPSAAALAAPRVLDLPGPDKAALAAEDEARLLAGDGGPDRFAWPADLALAPGDGDGWDRLPDGSHRWRLLVRAPGSLSLNLGFSQFRLPWGGRLVLQGRSGPDRVFTADDNAAGGQLWTPVVLGDEALLTLRLPAGSRDDFDLQLTRVGRGYRLFGEDAAAKMGDCNIDVVCPAGDDWRAEIRSVAVYTLGGAWTCTGAMVNTTAGDGTPYFLTAYHCNVSALNAATTVFYWNYESAQCGDLSGGSLDDAQSGATWRAGYSISDMTLLELAPPDTSWRVTYAGWDRSGAVPGGAVAIHHPSTDEKCISFENDPLRITSYLQTAEPGNGSHLRVVDWDLGTTEPGSSGSPLFDAGHRIVGQLHGGYAACGNDLSDWYGRLSVSWDGGGAEDSQLSAWLDPDGTGALRVDTYDPLTGGGGNPPPEPPAAVVLLGALENPAVGAATIAFDLPADGHVTLTIYDLRGRLVAVLVDDHRVADAHEAPWTDPLAPSGVYVARLEALGETHTGTFTLLR